MTKHISLRDVLEIMNAEDDPFIVLTNKDIQQFIDDVESCGQNILSPLDNDYLNGAISFLEGASVAGLFSISDDPHTSLFAMSMMENSEDFSRLVTIIFKFCIGLAALEELH